MTLYTPWDIAIINIVGIIFKLCLVSFMIVDTTKVQSDLGSSIDVDNSLMEMNLTNNSSKINDLKFPHIFPFRMDLFQKSLRELEIEAKQNIRKKKSVKREEKKIQANVMRNKIKDLMSNITKTLNDVDWYLSYEELVSEKNKEKESCVSEPTQQLLIKRMKEVDEETSDAFVDSFVQQMYDLDPSILDKINDRIDSEFSMETRIDPVRREVRLASTPEPRKTRLNTAIKNEQDFTYVDEFQEDTFLTKAPKYLKGVNRMFKDENIAKLLDDKDINFTTTTTVSTTYENFYDYADYYRENGDDKLRDVAHYEIVQDALHSTQTSKRAHHRHPYAERIKNNNEMTRNFLKNKLMFKKKLKNRLENFELKNYNEYNIDSDF